MPSLRRKARIVARNCSGSTDDLMSTAVRRIAMSGADVPMDTEEFDPYAKRVIENAGRDQNRRDAARKSHEALYVELFAQRMHPNVSIALVEKAINEVMRMDERWKQVLELNMRGLSSAQISEALDVPASTVRDRLAKARELIRIRIEDAKS